MAPTQIQVLSCPSHSGYSPATSTIPGRARHRAKNIHQFEAAWSQNGTLNISAKDRERYGVKVLGQRPPLNLLLRPKNLAAVEVSSSEEESDADEGSSEEESCVLKQYTLVRIAGLKSARDLNGKQGWVERYEEEKQRSVCCETRGMFF